MSQRSDITHPFVTVRVIESQEAIEAASADLGPLLAHVAGSDKLAMVVWLDEDRRLSIRDGLLVMRVRDFEQLYGKLEVAE